LQEDQAKAEWPIQPLDAMIAAMWLPCEMRHAWRIGKGLLDLTSWTIRPIVMPRVLKLVPQRRHATQVTDDVKERETRAVPSLMHQGTADADQRPTDEQCHQQTDVEKLILPEMVCSTLQEHRHQVDSDESSDVQKAQEQAIRKEILLTVSNLKVFDSVETFHVFHEII
jgi:hypothetical protein